MRIRTLGAVAFCLAAAPAFAQNPDVTGPRTLTTPMVMCTDLPIPAKPAPRLVIAGPHTTDGRTAVTNGVVIIKRTPDDGLAVGQHFISQRLNGDPKNFPRPGEGFGDMRVTGWLTIQAVDEINALAQIDFACDSVEAGDQLEPYAEPVLPTSASAIAPPDFSDRAHILFGIDSRVAFADGDLASIDRGTAHGVVTGARYAIYRDTRAGLPLIYIGEAVVMATSEQTSKVMVTQALNAIESGDVVVPRRTP